MLKEGSTLGVALLAVGVAVAGWFVGNGFVRGRTADRYVSVKGVSERDVVADIALWPIRFTASDNVLADAQKKFDSGRQNILAFLAKNGIDASHTELQSFEVADAMADRYRSESPSARFIISGTLMVRVDDPQVVQKASQNVGELAQSGVAIASGNQYGGGGPTYLFTRLNDSKPQMIAEATASAREAAQQFAKDSGSHLGPIRQASQGVFQILPRDRAQGVAEESQLNKTVRVVTTVEYYLEH
ncbi:MAG TPA: SIMPL domain-containing protein [Candidatus Krumholzibacteria bacterium]|nr:SIMPL domain-containing protein [Candidatus Krumholzibacteria bacterium]